MTKDDLRSWRLALDIRQEDAASLLGVTLRTYNRWETGKTIQHPRILELACAAVAAGLAGDRRTKRERRAA